MSSTRPTTTAPRATPRMTPTAKARAFDFGRNALNSPYIRHLRRGGQPAPTARDATLRGEGRGRGVESPLLRPLPGPRRATHGRPVPGRDREGLRARPSRTRSSAARCSVARSLTDARVQVALSMLNRHGLIAGATGTGKTKTLQLLAGQLSEAGVPVFVADIKGDLTRASRRPATPPTPRSRAGRVAGLDFEPAGHPVEFLSLSGALGAQVRASVHSFGPLLLGKVLDLNQTQTSMLSLCSSTATTTPCRCSTCRPRDDAQVPRRPTRASRSSTSTAACPGPRLGCSCVRWSSSSRRAPTPSSASPSSTSPT